MNWHIFQVIWDMMLLLMSPVAIVVVVISRRAAAHRAIAVSVIVIVIAIITHRHRCRCPSRRCHHRQLRCPSCHCHRRRCRRRLSPSLSLSYPVVPLDHDARHRDHGGQQRRRWATVAQWAAGQQGGHGKAGRWGQSILSS